MVKSLHNGSKSVEAFGSAEFLPSTLKETDKPTFESDFIPRKGIFCFLVWVLKTLFGLIGVCLVLHRAKFARGAYTAEKMEPGLRTVHVFPGCLTLYHSDIVGCLQQFNKQGKARCLRRLK